jgi:hypothetical protein
VLIQLILLQNIFISTVLRLNSCTTVESPERPHKPVANAGVSSTELAGTMNANMTGLGRKMFGVYITINDLRNA